MQTLSTTFEEQVSGYLETLAAIEMESDPQQAVRDIDIASIDTMTADLLDAAVVLKGNPDALLDAYAEIQALTELADSLPGFYLSDPTIVEVASVGQMEVGEPA